MKKTITKIIDYTVNIAEPEAIYLFGSMLTDRVNEFSDIDLLIISEKHSMKKNIKELIQNFAREISLKADVLVYSEKELIEQSEKSHSFLAAVVKTGEKVYQKKTEIC